MSFTSWLRHLRSAIPRGRRDRKHQRQRSLRPATFRPELEALEDRCLLSFSPVVIYPVGATPQAVVSGYFNNDNVLDLAVVNYNSSNVSVLLGNPDGTFQDAVNYDTGVGPRSIAIGDFDGDNVIDIATANAGDVSVLLGNGDGTFQAASNIALPDQFPSGYGGTDPLVQSPRSVATGDLNGDGHLDLAVTGVTSFVQSYSGYYGGTYYFQVDNAYVNVLLGNGSGGFSPAVTTPLSSLYPDSVAVGRFNADANDDLAIANSAYGSLSILLSDGSGGFSSSADFGTSSYPLSVVAGDVNGDHKTDLVTANFYGNNVSVLLGNGTGGFAAHRDYAVDGQPTSVVLGDVNADGKIDLVTSSNFHTCTYYGYYGGCYDGFNTGQVNVLLGYGTGNFTSPSDHVLDAGTYASGVAVGYFDGDSGLDVAVTDANNNTVSVLINDNSWPPLPPPSISISNVTVTEGNTGTVNANFTVSLSFASDVDVTVHYATANSTATAGSDYTATSGDVIIPAGETSWTVPVAVTGDRVGELTETFFVNLSAPVNATISDNQGVGTILDDEPVLSINDVTVTEGNTGSVTATFTVKLSFASDVDVTVHYSTANSTATAGSDYTATSGDVIIPHGQTSRTIEVAVTGDRLAESTESFFVNLSAPVNAGVADSQGVGTIVDNEPRISINNVAKKEGNGGLTQFIFTVTLSAAYDQTVTINYSTASGTATAGGDFQTKSGTLTFAPGVRTMTITINVITDKTRETDETFFVNLTGASSNALISGAQGIGTILDDDIPPGKKK